MFSESPNSLRFREARERAGFSPEEAARLMCISSALLREIESVEDELTSIHSPADVQRFCSVLGIRPQELLGVRSNARPLTAGEMAGLICEHCQSKGLAIGHFEHAVGWSVARSLERPVRFLHDYSVSGIQDICRELGVNWERFALAL
jgi:transcriptional regulator with XRE-family HTH domain